MLSFTLKLAAALAALIVAAAALFGPPGRSPAGTYPIAVRALAGLGLCAGSLALASAVADTFLRQEGLPAFKAAYVAVAAACGAGAAVLCSSLAPLDLAPPFSLLALAAGCSGLLWVRFYVGGH